MTAVTVELDQLKEIVINLQTNVQKLNSKSFPSVVSTARVGQHVPRRVLLPTPAPNPWVNGPHPVQQPAGLNAAKPLHPWSNCEYPDRANAPFPPPRYASRTQPVKQPKKAWKPSPARTTPESVSGSSGNHHLQVHHQQVHHQQAHHPQSQQQLRQPGGSLGGVRPPVSATAAARAHWERHAPIQSQQVLPPLNQVHFQNQQPFASVEANIPVSNRFAPLLANNLNI